MMLLRGPTRVVLVRSGVYDYAELELHGPVHLVAENNTGKTTLIAALQFLYVDEVKQMHFSHEWSETRKHYFPEQGSLILFECMTPTGFKVFGLRGLGPVQGHDFQRFLYTGPFDRADFLDDDTVRHWEHDVVHRLVGRSLTLLEPRQVRTALVGGADAKGIHLGLVPLKRAASYERFRFLFSNLLRLARIDQKDLKRLFIDISRSRLRKVKLDLRNDYADLFAHVERGAKDVDALRAVKPRIEELLDVYGRREALRARLVRLWAGIASALVDAEAETQKERERLDATEGELTRCQDSLAQQAADVAATASAIDQELGACTKEIERLEKLRERASSFVEELEDARRRQLAFARDSLVARLARATPARRDDVTSELAAVRSEIRRNSELLERYEDSVVAWLRAVSGLDDARLADVFRVLHPALLAAVIDETRVVVEDERAVLTAISRIARGFGALEFRGAGVRLPRATLPSEDEIAKHDDVERVRSHLAASRRREVDLDRTLKDIDARTALERERDEIDSDVRGAEDRLREWQVWRAEAPRLAGLVLDRGALRGRAAVCAAEREQVSTSQQAAAVKLHTLVKQREDLEEKLARIKLDLRKLSPPQAEWREDVEAQHEMSGVDGIRELIQQYEGALTDHGRVAKKVDRLFTEVEHETSGRYVGTSEAETIERLRDELRALPDHERSVQDLWTSLVGDLRSAFKALIEGVDEIRREVSRLTAALSRRRVSNLERVELQLTKQRDLVGRLNAVVEGEEAPLFSGRQGRSQAAQEIRDWLRDRPVIELDQLFDLRFRIVDRQGLEKTFDSLQQIESQGTSTTIKVLVHLELIRMMMTDEPVSVPFFLDEIAALDAQNLRALVDHATAMTFVPVVASPEARDCIDHLYFLNPQRGRLVLDERCRVVIRRGPPEDAA